MQGAPGDFICGEAERARRGKARVRIARTDRHGGHAAGRDVLVFQPGGPETSGSPVCIRRSSRGESVRHICDSMLSMVYWDEKWHESLHCKVSKYASHGDLPYSQAIARPNPGGLFVRALSVGRGALITAVYTAVFLWDKLKGLGGLFDVEFNSTRRSQ